MSVAKNAANNAERRISRRSYSAELTSFTEKGGLLNSGGAWIVEFVVAIILVEDPYRGRERR
jgi:hypothetical protein